MTDSTPPVERRKRLLTDEDARRVAEYAVDEMLDRMVRLAGEGVLGLVKKALLIALVIAAAWGAHLTVNQKIGG